jgi:glycosyltransferase involved in cell wall biosynthesis
LCLPSVVRDVRSCGVSLDILVVDDASTDETSRVLSELGVTTLHLPYQLGPGGAMRAALGYARQRRYDRVVRLDADGQHVAASIQVLLDVLDREQVDAVVGSRYRTELGYRPPLHQRVAQLVWGALLSRMIRSDVTDPTSGLWAFGPRAISLLADTHPSGFSELQLRLVLHRHNLYISEAATEMRRRLAGRSQFTFPQATLAMTNTVLMMAFPSPRYPMPARVYPPSGVSISR